MIRHRFDCSKFIYINTIDCFEWWETITPSGFKPFFNFYYISMLHIILLAHSGDMNLYDSLACEHIFTINGCYPGLLTKPLILEEYLKLLAEVNQDVNHYNHIKLVIFLIIKNVLPKYDLFLPHANFS